MKRGFIVAGLSLLAACSGDTEVSTTVAPALPDEVVEARVARQAGAAPVSGDSTQVLFGDLHVHTSFSPDAFILGLPLMGGSGLHPPADACDFARYCASLDFWSINDHAEGVTPDRWAATRESIRQCNAVTDPQAPDLVSFLGWEWSQVNRDPDKHYGHKNVIFPDTDDTSVPARAIASPRVQLAQAPMGRAAQWMLSLVDFENRDFYWGIQDYYDEIADTPICPKGVDTRDLPMNCLEIADDPKELFTKLDEWAFDSIVIPHGNAWGLNTPAGTTFDKQLNRQQHDARRQILFEVYSGHGNSEEYRDWRAVNKRDDGTLSCPLPSDDYLPCCWQAGEIIRQRCAEEGIDTPECERRAVEARQNFVDAGNSGHLTVPGQTVTDWLNCGVCEDCFNAPMDHRPATTAQYALAITDFADASDPLRYRFGFIGSTDNHGSRPGAGYKQVHRRGNTEAMGPEDPDSRIAGQLGDRRDPVPYSVPLDSLSELNLANRRNMERQQSFWLAGGLVAVHSASRERGDIWDALKQKQVYGTSGDRILLWFDALSADGPAPMGTEMTSDANPSFRVRAVGAFVQQPGCPDYARQSLGDARLEQLCGGECYNPGDRRYRIDRVEVVRIRPQQRAGEALGDLIEDPWRSFDCPEDSEGCDVTFTDPDFIAGGREAIYYVRALQEPTPAINGANVRCEYDAQGRCVEVNPCFGDFRTDPQDDCLAPVQQRAWSSPIFISPAASTATDTGVAP